MEMLSNLPKGTQIESWWSQDSNPGHLVSGFTLEPPPSITASHGQRHGQRNERDCLVKHEMNGHSTILKFILRSKAPAS